jgi:uncharacterized membrane protein (DUF485 family)
MGDRFVKKRNSSERNRPIENKNNGLGIASFVLGLIGLVLFLVFFIALPMTLLAIIFSIIQIRRNSNGLAIAGLVLGILGFLFSMILTILFVVGIYNWVPSLNAEVPPGLSNAVVMVRYDFEHLDTDGIIYSDSVGGSGIIYSEENGIFKLFTNRHVVDCNYNGLCGQRTNESVKIITNDAKTHSVSKVYIAPHDLDIAILEVDDKLENYSIASISLQPEKNDAVVAIGYPAFSENARQFSKAGGKITDFRELITGDGFRFKAIDSTAYAFFGSSGGGLFDSEGNLIGLTTWVDEDGISYAISAESFPDFSDYNSCSNGYYTDKGCTEYCEFVLDKNQKCVEPCDDFYCGMEPIIVNANTCGSFMVLGADGLCHKPCGSTNTYCTQSNAYCYKNQCLSCSFGETLFKDGYCYR